MASCSGVSTPSTVVDMPSDWPSPITALMMAWPVRRVVSSARKERSILNLVEGEGAQIGERGIAGAEIVHRDAARPCPEGMEPPGWWTRLLRKQQALGDFELQPCRSRPALQQRPRTCPTRSFWRNCTGERIERPRAHHRARTRRQRRPVSAPTPDGTMSPVSSATGMNSVGEMVCPSRSHAAAPRHS